MLMSILLFFQTDSLAQLTKEGAETVESLSIVDQILSGGIIGIGIAVVMLILAISATYIFSERLITIKRAQSIDDNFMERIRSYVQEGKIDEARALCENANTPVARLVGKGLQRIGKPLEDINTAVENVGNLEVYKLEKNLSNLASISGAAPMIGFFGTVTGMMISFNEMANATSVSPQLLAGGIYQALFTTAFGLFIGIGSFVGYNVLISNMNRAIFKMEAATVEFMDLLQEPV